MLIGAYIISIVFQPMEGSPDLNLDCCVLSIVSLTPCQTIDVCEIDMRGHNFEKSFKSEKRFDSPYMFPNQFL